MADIEPEFEISDQYGITKQYAGSVGTSSTAIPGSALATKIEGILIRCPKQTPVSRELHYSFDNTTFHVLSVGEFVAWEIQQVDGIGDIFQLYLKSNTSTVDYEVTINRAAN